MTERLRRVAADTNVVVSAILRPDSKPALAISHAISYDRPITSAAAIKELSRVLQRPKFDRGTPLSERLLILAHFLDSFELIDVSAVVTDCRDPSDNFLLELALSGRANLILTGDSDLLALHPWRGIPILTPAQYLAL